MHARSSTLLLTAAASFVLDACTTREIPHCGDGMPEVGHACLERQDVDAEALLAIADVDADGLDDAVVVLGTGPFQIAVQRGQAEAILAPPGAGLASADVPWSTAVGDADGDGSPEVLLWWPDESAGRICAHDLGPDGTLTERWCIPGHQPPSRFMARPRVGVLGPSGEAGFVAWGGGEALVVIDPAGAASETRLPLPINRNGIVEFDLVDLDGDGRDTLVWIGNDLVETYDPSTGTATGTSVEGLGHMVVADYDGDGIEDLGVQSGWNSEGFDMRLDLSSGDRVVARFGPNLLQAPIAGDLDGDGRAELMIATEGGLLGLWGHELAESDAPEPAVLDAGPTSDGHSSLHLADVDGDGIHEVLRVAGTDTPSNGFFPRWIEEIWRGDH